MSSTFFLPSQFFKARFIHNGRPIRLAAGKRAYTAFRKPPFPLLSLHFRIGGGLSRARAFCAAERTLDSSAPIRTIGGQGKGAVSHCRSFVASSLALHAGANRFLRLPLHFPSCLTLEFEPRFSMPVLPCSQCFHSHSDCSRHGGRLVHVEFLISVGAAISEAISPGCFHSTGGSAATAQSPELGFFGTEF